MNISASFSNLSVVAMAAAGWPAGMSYDGKQKIVVFVVPSGAMETRILECGKFPAIDAYALGGKLREQRPERCRVIRLVPLAQRNGVMMRDPVRYRREAGAKVRFV